MAKTAKKEVKKNGRPTKWKAEYATPAFVKEFIEYCKQEKETVTLCGLAVYIEVCDDTIQEWKESKSGFSVTTSKIKQISKHQLSQNGLNGTGNPRITQLLLSVNHGMIEKKDIGIDGTLNVIINN